MAAMPAPLTTIFRDWSRMGLIGVGGPPAHIALLRELCVDRRRWIDAREFEDANAACGLLPGPASTQLAIFCAWRVAGWPGAVVGGLAFIVPGLAMVIALAAATLTDGAPDWVLALGAGAGAAVVAVVAQAAITLGHSAVVERHGAALVRTLAYLVAGALAAALLGLVVVAVLLACGVVELIWRRESRRRGALALHAWPLLAATGVAALPAVAWTALKVGALSYGGGFVIIPLMRADAVKVHHWMTDTEFLNAVAFGQITPGPVTQTVAAVGYAAAGLGGALLAAALAFLPSFALVLAGARRFDVLRESQNARAFLDGAGPAAVGAIAGAAVTLLDGVREDWQWLVLVAAVVALLARRPSLLVLLGGVAAGGVGLAAGAPIPR